MEKIIWTYRVRNGDVLNRIKEDWIGYILRRNCLLTRVIGGKLGDTDVTRRQGRRRKQLVDNLKETRGDG
jgi:hypothetical protein